MDSINMIVTDNFTIWPMDKGNFWLQHNDGEGMNIPKKELDDFFQEYKTENF